MAGGVPHIFDSGIDDNSIAHLLDHSPAGAWAWFLAHACHSITILPDMTAQGPLDPAEGGEQPLLAFVPDLLSPFHNPSDSPEVQSDHD